MSEKFISPECMASIIGRISYINFDNVDPVFGSVQANTGCSSGIEGYSCQLEYINSIDWNSYCKSL
jgi:hypothetical protein